MRIQAPRGTQDVLPGDSHKWLHLESTFREVVRRYGYQELRTPTFEETELFTRTAGETSDIVTKQMYSFVDKGDRNITLKPEGTAPAVRAVIEHNLCPPGTVQRLSYITPIFRYERPQKGRLREAHQVGLELVGSNSPNADAEVIEITMRFYEALGLSDAEVSLNSIGRAECRAKFEVAILDAMADYVASLDEEGQAKARKNPLRLLDTKDPNAQTAKAKVPPILDFLEPESAERFEIIQRLLKDAGVRFTVDPTIVRGLDYYTETVFEVVSTKLGAQSSLCGGGRYDKLIHELGGSETPSVGVAMGIERALLVLEATGLEPEEPRPDAFVIAASPIAAPRAAEAARLARAAGLSVITDPDDRSLRSQLRQADKVRARWAVLVGEDELQKGTFTRRRLDGGDQQELPWDQLVAALQEP